MSATTEPNGHERSAPLDLATAFAEIARQSSEQVMEFMKHQLPAGGMLMADELGVAKAFMDLTRHMMQDPYKLAQAQMKLWQDYMTLWQTSMLRSFGHPSEPVAVPATTDKRFRHETWEEHFLFDYVKQSYLIAARHLHGIVGGVEGLDEKTKKKVDFFTRQYIDAIAPTNFVLTNPEVLRETIDSGGQNLVKGLKNLLDDIGRGDGQSIRIRMTDPNAFRLGENIANTRGKVVYQNELMQLLQYEPTTQKVFHKPLLIVPPWINKFYILDLREKNSFIKWAVDQGHTVFVISWVNPDAELAHKNFEDYLLEGPIDALEQIRKATGEREVNALGYCLGGTLLGSTLGYLAAKGDERIASATFFTTMLDFSEPGELEVFLDDRSIHSLERKMKRRGYLEGHEMAGTFNMLRAKRPDLVVRDQQLPPGQGPLSVRPAALELGFHALARRHAQLLPPQLLSEEHSEGSGRGHPGRGADRSRECEDSGLFPVRDRGSHRSLEVDVQGCAALRWAGQVRARRLRPYCRRRRIRRRRKSTVTGPIRSSSRNTDAWLAVATQHSGSWWPDWEKWVAAFAGGKVAARLPGLGRARGAGGGSGILREGENRWAEGTRRMIALTGDDRRKGTCSRKGRERQGIPTCESPPFFGRGIRLTRLRSKGRDRWLGGHESGMARARRETRAT